MLKLKLMRSILSRDPSSIQVSWKSVQWFLWFPADKAAIQKHNLLVEVLDKLGSKSGNDTGATDTL